MLESQTEEQRRMLCDEVHKFAKRIKDEYNVTMAFDDEAVELIVDRSLKSGKTIRALCESLFHDYQFGLALIFRNSGKSDFPITKEVVEDPDGTLSEWVVESYKK